MHTYVTPFKSRQNCHPNINSKFINNFFFLGFSYEGVSTYLTRHRLMKFSKNMINSKPKANK